jgi:L-ascorbate metabolism protein UlaG (beta-lactamase superfamily)
VIPARPTQLARAAILFVAWIVQVPVACGGLDSYRSLLVADEAAGPRDGRTGIRITYLGVNGYQFETGGRALLVDPYFSRVSLWSVAFNRPLEPNPQRIVDGLSHMAHRADAVLVTHAHFDHLLDVAAVMQGTGAQLYSGPSAVNLAQSVGVARKRCHAIKPGDVRVIGPWTIRAFAAQHDRVIGSSPPFPGTRATPGKPPVRPSDWILGEPLAFVVEAAGKRIYIDSGGQPTQLPPENVGPVDLAILGVALRDSRDRFASAVRRLQPRYILPSHQDDFFVPASRGFTFGKLTDFPAVKRAFEQEHLKGRLILLDYFRPWTLR